MRPKAQSTSFALYPETVANLDRLAEAAGVSRSRLIESFAEASADQAIAAVQSAAPVLEERKRARLAQSKAQRDEIKEKLKDLTPDQLNELLKRIG